MDANRLWVIKASLLILGISFIFFVIARPAFNFPMLYDETIRVLQIIFPVFVGYLGIGAAYLTQPTDTARATADQPFQKHQEAVARLLLRGPIYLIAFCTLALVAAFWLSNVPSARPGAGMSIDNFCWFLSLLMGLLAASSGLVVTRLFGVIAKDKERPGAGRRDVGRP